MKVLHLSISDISGGAARAAYRLHKGLQRLGVDSWLLAQFKNGDDPSVLEAAGRPGRVMNATRPKLDRLPLHLYPRPEKPVWSVNFWPHNLTKVVDRINPDIIHLHWVGDGFVPVQELARFKPPLVWTLHDSWAFTGGCHVPYECIRYQESCGRCPRLGSRKERDLSYRTLKSKAKHWRGIKLQVATPSRWLGECARASSLFREVPVQVIPNGLDTRRFRPVERETARELLGLPQDKQLILFGAVDATSDRNKGFHLLQPALRRLAAQGCREKAELMVFGASKPQAAPDLGLAAHYLGKLHDDISLALVYSAADVLVAPSIQENLSNVVMEALACGTPCAAFRIGGMPDLIDHEQNGYLAEPFSAEDLSKGLAWCLESKGTLRGAARAKVEREFQLEKSAGRYLELYRTLQGGYN